MQTAGLSRFWSGALVSRKQLQSSLAVALPPAFLPIGLDGAFLPILLGFGTCSGVWYLPEIVKAPWTCTDDHKLHLLRLDMVEFLMDLH